MSDLMRLLTLSRGQGNLVEEVTLPPNTPLAGPPCALAHAARRLGAGGDPVWLGVIVSAARRRGRARRRAADCRDLRHGAGRGRGSAPIAAGRPGCGRRPTPCLGEPDERVVHHLSMRRLPGVDGTPCRRAGSQGRDEWPAPDLQIPTCVTSDRRWSSTGVGASGCGSSDNAESAAATSVMSART